MSKRDYSVHAFMNKFGECAHPETVKTLLMARIAEALESIAASLQARKEG